MALGGRTGSRGELQSFLLFDPVFVAELIEMGRLYAERWLRRHPRFWCRDAAHDLARDGAHDLARDGAHDLARDGAHDLALGPFDDDRVNRVKEQAAVDEFRAQRRH